MPRSAIAKIILFIAAAGFALGNAARFAAQQRTADEFEAVSVRQSNPDRSASAGGRGGGGGSFSGCVGLPQIDPARIVFDNLTLYTLIAHAFGLRCTLVGASGLIAGGPDWARSERWIVQATIPQYAHVQTSGIVAPFRPAIEDARLQKMVQKVLADRFKLTIHRETKEISAYALTLAKNEEKLRNPENVPCTARGGNPFTPLKTGQQPYCSLEIVSAPVADFIAVLVDILGRPVIDKTGLTGTYAFRLLYADPRRQPDDSGAPSIFTALSEQLGLKVESTKGSVEVIVVDHAEKPSEN